MDNLFFDTYIWPLLLVTAHSLAIILVLLVSLAFFMYADRKIWAAVQLRRGPNVVGPFGLLQSFADILKYLFKEVIIPTTANKPIFLLAPFVTMFLALSAWGLFRSMKAGPWLRLTSASCIFLRFPRSAFMALLWAGGRQTRNIHSLAPFAQRRKWCPMKCPLAW